jgi:uncharacterized protein (DUF983 family)
MSKIINVLANRCPQCEEGNMFVSTNPYKKGEMTTMNKYCPKCNFNFEPEVGYYYGAMFVSYVLNVALFVIATVAFYVFFEDKVNSLWYMVGYVFLTFLLIPVLFRLSRSMWLHVFYKEKREVNA